LYRSLRLAFLGLFGCAALAAPQRPSEIDTAALLDKARTVALQYSRSLPDFVCTEVIERSTGLTDLRPVPVVWRVKDTLSVKLSYFDRKEDHKLILINGKPTDRTFDSLGGAIGMGEFGGMLGGIFEPSSMAAFKRESSRTLRGHRVAVYSYAIRQDHSTYLLSSGAPGATRQALVAFHGSLEIDTESASILRFTYQADNIPKDVVLTYALSAVDYDFAKVGGREYLLPSTSETEMHTPKLWLRNHIRFRDYNKYGSDSIISFEPPK
jgi:hypothetical protein